MRSDGTGCYCSKHERVYFRLGGQGKYRRRHDICAETSKMRRIQLREKTGKWNIKQHQLQEQCQVGTMTRTVLRMDRRLKELEFLKTDNVQCWKDMKQLELLHFTCGDNYFRK